MWNWLPAFLAVAEHGTTASAAKHLGLTGAAVSRTVRLLEDRLGQPLFHRHGRTLSLNDRGARLRDAVRGAFGGVEAGLRALELEGRVDPLRVSSLGLLTEHYVVGALLQLDPATAPRRPEHFNQRPREAIDALRRYTLDLVFHDDELDAEGLLVEDVGHAPKSVYCGRGHPLFEGPDPDVEVMLAHPFSVPQVGDSGSPMDGWPSRLPRVVGMRVTLLRSNLEVSRSGRFLTVLPDVTARDAVRSGELRRLGAPELSPIALKAVRRPEDADDPALDRVVSSVRRAVEADRAEIEAAHAAGQLRAQGK